MLSRQSALLVTDADLIALERKLRERGDVLFFSDRANAPNDALLPLTSLAIDDRAARPSLLCYLAPADRAFVLKLDVLSAVKTSVDIDESELIALWRSYITDVDIGRGTIYYLPRYSKVDGILRDKDPIFVKWAQNVFGTIKRSLTFDKKLHAYIGADAAEQIQSGQLSLRRSG